MYVFLSRKYTGGKLQDGLKSAMTDLKKKQIKKLFVFFSGHYLKDKSHFVWKVKKPGETGECLRVSQLIDHVNSFDKLQTVIFIFDCCFAPNIIRENCSPKPVIFQINSSNTEHKSLAEKEHENSYFTRFLIQGLTQAVDQKQNCFLSGYPLDSCEICSERLPKKKDYINILALFEYIDAHMKAQSEKREKSSDSSQNSDKNIKVDWRPALSVVDLDREKALVAYSYVSDVTMKYIVHLPGKSLSVRTVDAISDSDYFKKFTNIKDTLVTNFVGKYLNTC